MTFCNFAVSIAVTRYFGKDLYGQYSYFLWLSGVLAILAGFGFQQTVAKFLPKYFFGEKEKTAFLAKKLLLIQIVGSAVVSGLCILGVQFFGSLITFDGSQKTLLLIITFLSIIPLSLNNFLSGSLSAVQEFKKLSRTYIVTGILNLALVLFFVESGQNIVNFLLLYWGFNLVSSCILAFQARGILTKPKPVPSAAPNLRSEKLFSYSLYSWISAICTQIVWERSELLFLGMFSDSGQIATYTLAYGLAVLFISVWGPINSVLTATTSEVIATQKQDKLLMITRHGTKYLAMLMLPLALLASFFIGDVVTLVYGQNFRDVALLFPPLVFSHAIAVIITPAGSVPMLKHEMKKTMFFNISTAVLNVFLDFYLITKYQAFGAMLANVISQFFSIGLALINAKKYRLGIFNKHTVRVFILNILLAGILLATSPFPFIAKIPVALLAGIIYMAILLKTAFNGQDVQIFKNLSGSVPQFFRPAFSWLGEKIKT